MALFEFLQSFGIFFYNPGVVYLWHACLMPSTKRNGITAFDFGAAPSAEPLIEAVGVLREMNEKGRRKVPEDAPTSFVKPRWCNHVVGAEGEIDRRYYELSALSELKNSLRSGDV